MKTRLFSFAPILFLLYVPFIIADCESKQDISREHSGYADGTYVGTALRGETDCMSNGSCYFCTATDTVQLVRKQGEITINSRGPGLTFTPCKTGPDENNPSLKGTYDQIGDYEKFEVTWCNGGKGTPAGGGTIVGGTTVQASFSCETIEHGSLKIEWNDVVLTKQG